jgi:3-hydroxyisobutyrate dehydrogenase-like beta-hydroxyacid dehydrogenase
VTANVAFLGLGGMGSRIARRLLDAGHSVTVWNRTPERTDALAERGARVARTPAEAASQVEALITMLADPAALDAVVGGRHGVAAGARRGLTVIEMSTVGPAAVARLATSLPAGTYLLDAPVLGSLSEAESGSLQVFVGGPDELAERWAPLLADLGTPIHVGPLGSGAAAKLVVNLTLFGAIGLLGEALALARVAGLSREIAFEILSVSPLAEQAARRREAVESGEYPRRFALSLARKDTELIAEAAGKHGLDLRLATAARSWLLDAEAAGLGDRDYSELLAHIISDKGRW